MKVWHGTYATPHGRIDARHRDGRHAAQVVAAVRTTSQKAAAAALRCSVGYLRDYFGVDPADAYIAERCPLLAKVEPGTVVVLPMDPGDTVNGQTDWIAVPRG